MEEETPPGALFCLNFQMFLKPLNERYKSLKAGLKKILQSTEALQEYDELTTMSMTHWSSVGYPQFLARTPTTTSKS